jgi:hypothetical protein
VSDVFKEEMITDMDEIPDSWLRQRKWTPLKAEPTGLINISRLHPVNDSVNTVLTRITINSDRDQVKKLDIGYSERLKLYCNGKALYSGNTGFRTRDYRYLGTIGYFDAVYLPLRKGENVIVVSLTETFGGWGIMGKIENRSGISIGGQ